MDRNNLLAILLITLIVAAWLIYNQMTAPDLPEKNQNISDSTLVEQKAQTDTASADSADDILSDSSTSANASNVNELKFGKTFAPFANGNRKVITIETDLVTAKFSTMGGDLVKWELKNYKKWDKKPTQLISDKKGELFLEFLTYEGKKIDSRDLFFDFNLDKDYYQISGKDSILLNARLNVAPDKYINKTFVIYADKYHINTDISLQNMQSFIPERGYNFIWSDGLSYQEKNSVDESNSAEAMASMNGEIEYLNADESEEQRISPTGIVDYTAIKLKYFVAAIMPRPQGDFDGTIDLSGRQKAVRNEGLVEKYNMSYRIPYRNASSTNKFMVYIGPMEYDILSEYGLSETIDMGWKWLVRPIGEFFMLPILQFIHDFVPNYGVAIILFSILIKILLYPLSIQQMRSANKMKLLQPEMEKLREKYKDDNTKQQQATMKLYSEYGVNPAGGCLPLLLQMPILYSLWSILRSAIDLRQTEFIWWINDLSVPDVLVSLPFRIPLFNIDQFSGLALAMGVTMFIQQKLTITDPRQKAMVYMMPVMFTLLFSSFPSGLNLYYFMFNLVGIIQQVYINKFSKNQLTLDDLKKAPKKEGWFQKKLREAQEVAASQGKTVPGKKAGSGGTERKGYIPPKKKDVKKSSPKQGGKKKK